MLVGVKMKGAKTVSAVRLIDQLSPSLERPPEEHRKTLDFPKDFWRQIHQSLGHQAALKSGSPSVGQRQLQSQLLR